MEKDIMCLIALVRPKMPIKIYAVTFTRESPLSNGLSTDLPQNFARACAFANPAKALHIVVRPLGSAKAVRIARDVPGDMLFTSGCSI